MDRLTVMDWVIRVLSLVLAALGGTMIVSASRVLWRDRAAKTNSPESSPGADPHRSSEHAAWERVRQLEEEIARLRPPPPPPRPERLRVLPWGPAAVLAATVAAIVLVILLQHVSVHEAAMSVSVTPRAHPVPDLGAKTFLPSRHRIFEVTESNVFQTELLKDESSLLVDFHFSKKTYVNRLDYFERPWDDAAYGQGYGHGTLLCVFHQDTFQATIVPHDPPFYMYPVQFDDLASEPPYFEAGDTVRCLLESEAGLHGLWRVSLWTDSQVESYECPEGEYLLHHLDSGFTAMAWWDRQQGDDRPVANSVLLLRGRHEAGTMLAALKEHFPQVLKNLRRGKVELREARP